MLAELSDHATFGSSGRVHAETSRTKSHAGRRSIGLPDGVLREHRDEQD
ncbi:hypothetical protein Vqi01_46640 [Micromonospora qiuiae]|uniref:Uncharacterized protein n=1 Tax=Micromonospora qiuiae TaxID=502268 RepID=A0ABQ4JIY6_9ACTN|nr:hypothetical protein Vqi01_46640 [Micromonospora qiuiae]